MSQNLPRFTNGGKNFFREIELFLNFTIFFVSCSVLEDYFYGNWKQTREIQFHEIFCLLLCICMKISGDFGGHVHIWELEFVRPTMVHIKKYHTSQIHKSHVVCMNVSARRIVSGSRDKSVLVQDFWASVTKK